MAWAWISNICLKTTRTLNFARRNTYCCSQNAKNLAYLSLVCPNLEYAAAAWIHIRPNISSTSNESNVVLPVLLKKIIVIQLLSLVCSTNLVGCPWSNVANSLVWRFSTRHLITFQPFLWITSQFHYSTLEPPMKINLCHCQFVLMLLNNHFFLGPLPIGIPSHWLFASRSRFSLSVEVCWARHPPIIANHHDIAAVTGGLLPLLDIR